MKLFKKLALSLLFFPLLAGAQSKVGAVNTQKIVDDMPEVKIISASLDSLNKVYQGHLKSLYDEYQAAVAKHDDQGAQQVKDRIQAFETEATQDIQKKSRDRMAPVREKISQAIKTVAKEHKYTMVIDSSNEGNVLYLEDADDLTPLVRKKLGI